MLSPNPEDPKATLDELRQAGLVLRAIMDTRDVAVVLRRSPSAVRRMRQRGELPMARLGRRYIITRQALTAWIEQRARRQTSETGGAR